VRRVGLTPLVSLFFFFLVRASVLSLDGDRERREREKGSLGQNSKRLIEKRRVPQQERPRRFGRIVVSGSG